MFYLVAPFCVFKRTIRIFILDNIFGPKMKTKMFLIFLLSLTYCFEENTYTSTITFSSNGITASGDEVKIEGTNATILKSGSF